MKNDIINNYCFEHSEKENYLQKKIRKHTFEYEKFPQMLSGLMVGNILFSLIKSINAKKILEVGMFTGYGTASMVKALPLNGEIHTCEYMEEHIKTAKKHFRDSRYHNMINFHQGLAIDTLESFKINSFDFAFIDADKINYKNYYLRCVHLIKSKGIIVLDNMLWSGGVVEPTGKDSQVLRETADYIQKDERVFNTLIPIRDGLMICIKK